MSDAWVIAFVVWGACFVGAAIFGFSCWVWTRIADD